MTAITLQYSPPLRAVLFDLDNTLYDRDLAFQMWARGFVEEQFSAESETGRTEIVQQIIAIDAHGYVTKQVLFTQVRALYPTITQEVEMLCERFYQEWLVHMALDTTTIHLMACGDHWRSARPCHWFSGRSIGSAAMSDPRHIVAVTTESSRNMAQET